MTASETSSATRERLIEPTRIAALVDRAPHLLGLLDADGTPLYLSPAAVALLTGGSAGAILDADEDQRTLRIHPDDVERIMTAFDTAAAVPGERVTFSARTKHADGTWRHFEGECQNLLEDPEVDGIILSIKDVTDRAAVERELRDRLRIEATLAMVARDLMRVDGDDVDGPIQAALENLGALLGAHRASIFLLRGDVYERTHAWSQVGAPPRVEQIPVDRLSSWLTIMSSGQATAVGSEQLLPIVPSYAATGLHGLSSSVLAVALVAREQPLGFLAFGRDEDGYTWPSGSVEFAEQFGALVTTALERRDAEQVRKQSQEALRTTAERFSRLVQNSPDLVLVLDATGCITFASPAATTLFGYEPDELLGMMPWDLLHPDDVPRAIEAFARAVTDFQPEFVPLRVRHKDGTWIPVETIGSELFDDPLVAGLLVNVRDVRERERIAAELRDVEARFRQAWSHAPIGMAFAGRDGRFLEVNPALCEMLGVTEQALLEQTISALTHPDDIASNQELHDSLYRDEISGYSLEKRFRHADGSWRWVRVSVTPIRDADGSPMCSLGQIEDITERREFEERLAWEATHDGLTGLPLRKLLLDHLDLALAASRRAETHVGVLFIDLDHFKRVNDSFGHSAGDRVLVQVAERLRASVRDGDTPGRFGGDEFVVVCPALADPRDVVSVADRILESLATTFNIDGVDMYVGASIGIAVAEPGIDAQTLLRQADTAAYRAKDHGRNRYEIFDAELRASVFARLETEMALRKALESDELLVLYQPVVTAVTGEVVGFEALVRWDRPGHGRLSPSEFLAVAEDTGLIVPIGRHVLSHACQQLAAWQLQRPDRAPFLAVNVSPRQLFSPELVDDVRDIIERTGINPENLWLELPETLLVHDTPQLVALLMKLRDLGVQLSLDDFGTGFSSLAHLRFLPVGVVKIDRSFTAELGRTTQGTTIVAAVISLAHALGMRVIAEGVETVGQLDILRMLNCDWIQGFYFSTPLHGSHANQALATGSLRR